MEVTGTLEQRQATHGDFKTGASISQDLCELMRATRGWSGLSDAQREALEMVAHKVARILNGNPDFADHWHDIAGYAVLVEKLCSDYKADKK